ncbi:hypothetical protein [Nocardiopsis halophila]|uniref:hypothetical protein n=1 Tax=Nocardiopsis halophila TaxID=141692 RepID=UPI00036E43C1|nr:hypothetical protein [Nocardiopsis halophila]
MGQVAHPHRQVAVGGVGARLAEHGRERIGPGEGRRLDELVLPMLDFALGHRTVFVAVQASGEAGQVGVHERGPCAALASLQ